MYVCASCASVCGGARGAGGVHVLAGPLRHTSRFDSLHMCGVHRWSSVVLCGAPRVNNRLSRVGRAALVARGGALSHRYQNFSTAHARRDSRAHPHAARPAAGRPGARSGPGSGTVAHPHAETSSTQKRSQRDTHILIRLAPSAPRGAGRARAHFRSRGKHAVRRAGTAVWGRAAALRINGLKRCDRESPVSPNVNIQVKSSLTGLLFP